MGTGGYFAKKIYFPSAVGQIFVKNFPPIFHFQERKSVQICKKIQLKKTLVIAKNLEKKLNFYRSKMIFRQFWAVFEKNIFSP